ncbi:MAG TPA: hypothetical protein VKY31_13395 [Terriglobia bacterium]|nr:hypothetical protein [Terriglobia bacterium]
MSSLRNRINIGISTLATAGSLYIWDLRESMTEAEIEIILEAVERGGPRFALFPKMKSALA